MKGLPSGHVFTRGAEHPAGLEYLHAAVRRINDALSKVVSDAISKSSNPTFLVHPPGQLIAHPNLDWSWSSNSVDPVDLTTLNEVADRMAKEFWSIADEFCSTAGTRWVWLEERATSLADFETIYTFPPGGFVIDGQCYAWSDRFAEAPGPHWLDAHSSNRAWFAAVRGLSEPFDRLLLEDLEVCIVVAAAMDDEGYVVQFLSERFILTGINTQLAWQLV